MQITRDIETQKGPAEWFTGDVYIDAVAAPAGGSTFAAAAVHFTPGARTAWHGATPDRFMVHIAMQQVDESGSPVTWGEHVTDEQYGVRR